MLVPFLTQVAVFRFVAPLCSSAASPAPPDVLNVGLYKSVRYLKERKDNLIELQSDTAPIL